MTTTQLLYLKCIQWYPGLVASNIICENRCIWTLVSKNICIFLSYSGIISALKKSHWTQRTTKAPFPSWRQPITVQTLTTTEITTTTTWTTTCCKPGFPQVLCWRGQTNCGHLRDHSRYSKAKTGFTVLLLTATQMLLLVPLNTKYVIRKSIPFGSIFDLFLLFGLKTCVNFYTSLDEETFGTGGLLLLPFGIWDQSGHENTAEKDWLVALWVE